MNTLLFDTETTGIPRHPNAKPRTQPRIIEFGGALVNSRGEILEEISVLVNPEELSTVGDRLALTAKDIKRITGIEYDALAEEPLWEEVVDDIRPLFAAADQVIAHNLPFDYNMVNLEVDRIGLKHWPWPPKLTCSAQELEPVFGRIPKLIHAYEYYVGKPLAQTHRALDDVKAMLEMCIAAGGFL